MGACRCWCLGWAGTQVKVTYVARRAGRRLAPSAVMSGTLLLGRPGSG
jgi:hypothetical protein